MSCGSKSIQSDISKPFYGEKVEVQGGLLGSYDCTQWVVGSHAYADHNPPPY